MIAQGGAGPVPGAGAALAVFAPAARATMRTMSLRGQPVRETVTLPDGREVVVSVGIPDDPYVRRRELDTVALELRAGDEVLAALNTVLAPQHTSEARTLARQITAGLASGELEPTAGALEPLAGSFPAVRDSS
jgi:hypothetical protein